MYPPHHLGGYELVWQGTVRALRAAGHPVRVLTTDVRMPGVEGDGLEPDVARSLRWYWRDHRFPRLGRRARARLEADNAETLARELAAFAPDVVAWWSMGGMSLSLLGQVARSRVPAAAFVHDDWVVYGPKVDQSLGRRSRVLWRAVARWVFVSETTRRHALAAAGDLGPTEVAPSGIDPAFVDPAPVRPWGWRLLYVGRLDPRKGVDTLLETLPALPPTASLMLAGGGDAAYERALRSRAGSRVSFLGSVSPSRLFQVYADADAVVFPVVWEEPWGLVPLEAMGRGVPVVATGRGGSGEYLRDGENCVLFPAGDAAGLAAAVRRLAEDSSLRARLRAAGILTASGHTAPRFERRVVEVLDEVASAW
jgi:glycosyltransferase involved in cell wall biosynthesis